MTGFELHRIGLVMEPEPGNPREAEGILNPAAVRGASAGLMLLSKEHPGVIRFRSTEPVLATGTDRQRRNVANVVFPTGIDRRDDLGSPNQVAFNCAIKNSSPEGARLRHLTCERGGLTSTILRPLPRRSKGWGS